MVTEDAAPEPVPFSGHTSETAYVVGVCDVDWNPGQECGTGFTQLPPGDTRSSSDYLKACSGSQTRIFELPKASSDIDSDVWSPQGVFRASDSDV